jgi:hypothetical protein
MAFGDDHSLEPEPGPHHGNSLGIHSDDISNLMRWRIDGEIPRRTLDLLLADPRLPVAARVLATNFLAAAANDKSLDGIFKDAGRYVAAMSAIHLHTTGNITLPKLKAICAASGLLSPGRARALLSYLRYLDYVVPLSAATAGAPARYAPTATLIASWRSHLCAALEAASVIEPAVRMVLDRLHDAEILEQFVRIEGGEFLGATGDLRHISAFVRIFLHRHAGIQIIWSIVAQDSPDFPSREPVPFSIAATARRFGVSRIHIRRLLDEAAREGLLRCGNDGAITLEESARSAITFLYAAQLIGMLSAAGKMIMARPDLIDGRGGAGLGQVTAPAPPT